MTHAQQMVQTNPSQAPVDAGTPVECIEAYFDCADMCDTTGRILSRQTASESRMIRAALQAYAQACMLCGDECEQHAQHSMQHCQACMDSCRRRETACNNVLSALAAS